MLKLEKFDNIYLHKEYVDFRKSVNGLSIIVEEDMVLNVFSKFLFVFCNKKRNKLKVLYWDKTGFALWYKRLEENKFIWPKKHSEEIISVNSQQMQWLLEGYNIWNLKPHKKLKYKSLS